MTAFKIAGWSTWTAEDGAPSAALIPAAARRRTSRLTRIAAHVIEGLEVDASSVPLVFGSDHGEAHVTIELLRLVFDEGASSPIRFTNSVHNASAGHLTIALENRGFSTTVSAGRATVAMTLLEAAMVLRHAPRVIVVIAEEPIPAPLALQPSYASLGAAFMLQREGPWAVKRVTDPPAAPRVPASVAASPCAPALAVVAALQAGSPRVLVESSPSPGDAAWCLELGQ